MWLKAWDGLDVDDDITTAILRDNAKRLLGV